MSRISVPQALQIAVRHHAAGQLPQAEQLYRQILAAEPNNFDALQLLGTLAHTAGHVAAAIELMQRALAIDPSVAPVRANLASALRSAGQPAAAMAEVNTALKLEPNHPNAHVIRALLLSDAGQMDQAREAWQKVTELQPTNAEAHANLAASCEMLGQLHEAITSAQRAVELNPNYAIAHMNLGASLAKLGRLEEALASHRRSIELRPDLVMGWVNASFVASQLGMIADAEMAARKATELNPNEIGAWQNLAAALQDQGRLDEASDAFARAIALLNARAAALEATIPQQATADRQLAAVLGAVSATLLPSVYESIEEIDRWRNRVIEQIAKLKSFATKLQIPIEPAPTLFALAYQGRDDLQINRDFASLVEPPPDPPLAPRSSGGKIRVGLISRFFRHHTIGRLNMGLVEQLDRGAFDVTVLSVGDRNDDVANFMRAKADRFIAIPPRLDIARATIAEQKLDILYYADIGMDPVTYSLAYSRLAPVQCVTWGHPVTSGIPAIDHFISSESLEAPGSESQYTENLIRLKSIAVYYYRPKLTDQPKTRADFGLDDDATLYGCLQMLWKFHPTFDPILGEILRRDPKGIVVIVSGLTKVWDDQVMSRMRRTIPDVADRIRFLPRQSYSNFLALTSLCDMMLDPTIFGGGNTTYEALAFGVPVITLPSQFLRGRISKALYDQMGVEDFVATSPGNYIDIAARLGCDRDALRGAKQKISDTAGVLFENPAGVRELEAFFKSVINA